MRPWLHCPVHQRHSHHLLSEPTYLTRHQKLTHQAMASHQPFTSYNSYLVAFHQCLCRTTEHGGKSSLLPCGPIYPPFVHPHASNQIRLPSHLPRTGLQIGIATSTNIRGHHQGTYERQTQQSTFNSKTVHHTTSYLQCC